MALTVVRRCWKEQESLAHIPAPSQIRVDVFVGGTAGRLDISQAPPLRVLKAPSRTAAPYSPARTRRSVNGQCEGDSFGGHQNCPFMANRTAQWRTAELPTVQWSVASPPFRRWLGEADAVADGGSC